MDDLLILLVGLVSAWIGGELFVRGTVSLAQWARVSPGIIGLTVAAFATSSPELSVSINAAIDGTPLIALGDALGSNVVNVAVVLGIAAASAPVRSPRDSIQRDFRVALLVPVVTVALVVDGELSRRDGFLMFAAFAFWLIKTALQLRKQRIHASASLDQRSRRLPAVLAVPGLALLLFAGDSIVNGAQGIAARLGFEEFVIGATLVAVGTSVPELATTIVAKLRGQDELGLGTILGSNIFNGFFIVAVAASIHPMVVNLREVSAALAFGLAGLILAYPNRSDVIERKQGVLLLLLYIAYITVTLTRLAG